MNPLNEDLSQLSTTITVKRRFTKVTEIHLGVELKSDRWFEWLPVISIGFAAVLCLITIVVLCKRHISHRFYTRLHSTSTESNENNNQTKQFIFDVAECIDDEMKFEEGMHLLLARGNLELTEEIARQLNRMNRFERILFFQGVVYNNP